MNKQEDSQNRALALLLAERGMFTYFEQRESRRRMDIVDDMDGSRVVLVTETRFHRKALPSRTPKPDCVTVLGMEDFGPYFPLDTLRSLRCPISWNSATQSGTC